MQYFTIQRATRALVAAGLATFLSLGAAHAESGFERGPEPTSAALAATGSFDIASHVISAASAGAYGYGGATVYYPQAAGQTFGIVSLTPGFLGKQAQYQQLARHIASHGFIVINLDTNSVYDVPDLRAREMAGALKNVIALAKGGKVPFAGVADISRRAVVGHSMGGGGTLTAAQADRTLKAAVPLTPWHTTKSFPGIQVPTLIVACQNDDVAPNKTHSDKFYASLNTSLPRGEVEVKGASHLCPISTANEQIRATVGKSVVAWLKRFLDEDTRYDALVKGGINDGEYSRFDTAGF